MFKVGDVVCFKSDFEQCGKIVQIKNNMLLLQAFSDEGFEGEYIAGEMHTWERASDCWAD